MAKEIRAATLEDYDDLCALCAQVDALHRDNLPRRYQKPRGPAREKDDVLGLIADKEVGLFVAEAAGVVVGFVNVSVCESPPIPIFVPRRYAVVANLVVDPRFQRAGIGRALMEHVHRWAAVQGASEVELTVYSFNETALTFYEGLGYTHVSSRMCRPLEPGSP